MPPHTFRFANIELPKNAAWAERQRQKSFFKRAWEIIEERRFKFYIKEGIAYTMKTGVPGVWEEVARGIRARSETNGEKKEAAGDRPKRIAGKKIVPAKKEVVKVQIPQVRRQTLRRV